MAVSSNQKLERAYPVNADTYYYRNVVANPLATAMRSSGRPAPPALQQRMHVTASISSMGAGPIPRQVTASGKVGIYEICGEPASRAWRSKKLSCASFSPSRTIFGIPTSSHFSLFALLAIKKAAIEA